MGRESLTSEEQAHEDALDEALDRDEERQPELPNVPEKHKIINFFHAQKATWDDYSTRDYKQHCHSDELAKILSDPVAFADFAGVDLWSGQLRILDDLASHGRVAVRAGHSVVKTYVAGFAALLWVWSRPNARVLLLAPTWNQAKSVTLKQVKDLLREHQILQQFATLSDVEELEAMIKFGLAGQSEIRAISTNDPSRLQGYHGNVLIIMDEAGGIHPDLFGAVEGIAAGGSGSVGLLAIGNPTVAGTPFERMFDPSSPWRRHRIGADVSPNFHDVENYEELLSMSDYQLSRNHKPYLITKDFVRDKLLEWGESSNAFQSRVHGEFPSESADTLISPAWLERCQAPIPDQAGEPIIAGVDVAYKGSDSTVVIVREGSNVIGAKQFQGNDCRGPVVAYLREFPKVNQVRVDVIGTGSYFAEHLAGEGFTIARANVAEAPSRGTKHKFLNLRAEAYWSIRDQIKDRQIGNLGCLPDRVLKELCVELTATGYEYDPKGRLKIEAKENLKKRLATGSPDLADAFMLCFAAVGRWGLPQNTIFKF